MGCLRRTKRGAGMAMFSFAHSLCSLRKTGVFAICALAIAVSLCFLAPLCEGDLGSSVAFAAQEKDPGDNAAAPAAVLDGWSQNENYWYYHYNGVPASGWKQIYHSGVWDYYYFIDGRMQTGWLADGDRTYYLADEAVGSSFNSIDYGTMLHGLHKIGAYDYCFYIKGTDHDLEGRFLDGEMIRDTSWLSVFQDGKHICYGRADANGRVTLIGFDEEDPDMGPRE